jgi:hypothetical protein
MEWNQVWDEMSSLERMDGSARLRKVWMTTVRAHAQRRYEGMKQKQYPRAMVDETIIGGPFVRYTPDPETMFMVVEKVGEKEFVRAICPLVIWDRWGSFTVGAFRRCGCDETEDYWIEKIAKIIDTYQFRKEEDRYSKRISMERIAEEGYNLNISRYISTAVAETEIVLKETHADLVRIEKAIQVATLAHNEFLKELGLPLLPHLPLYKQ